MAEMSTLEKALFLIDFELGSARSTLEKFDARFASSQNMSRSEAIEWLGLSAMRAEFEIGCLEQLRPFVVDEWGTEELYQRLEGIRKHLMRQHMNAWDFTKSSTNPMANIRGQAEGIAKREYLNVVERIIRLIKPDFKTWEERYT